MAKRGPKPKRTIPTSWSPDIAYAVGLLTTDGNLSKDGRHIELTSKDREQIETFKACLGLKAPTRRKQSGYNPESYSFRVQFGNVLFYEWLTEIGLAPNKSKTLGALRVPDDYFFDFLRGCFDGDGSMHAYWDPRWHSSYMFYTSFASASAGFLEWLQGRIYCLSGAKGVIQKATNSHQLRFAKRESRTVFKQMFYSKDLPRLERKFAKAQEIFTMDEAHNESSAGGGTVDALA